MGITAAIVFGYIFAIIFKPKSKINWLIILNKIYNILNIWLIV
jgi:hypothetical protein